MNPSLLLGMLLGAWVCAPLCAQSLTVMQVTGAPGETVNFEILWDAPPSNTASTIQWDTMVPAQVLEEYGAGVIAGRAAQESGKTVTCAARKAYLYSCLLGGGKLPIPNGPVAMFQFKIKPDAGKGTSFFRIENAEALTTDLTKVALNNTEGAIVVNSRPAGPQGNHDAPHHDVPKSEAPSPAYSLLEHHLQPIYEARSRLSYQEARDVLAKAQEAIRIAQAQAASGPAGSSASKPNPSVLTANPRLLPPRLSAPPPVAASKSAAAPPAAASAPPAAEALTDAEALNQRGREFLNQKKFAEALKDLNEAIRLKPDFYQAFNARGFTHYMQRDLVNARKDLDEAIRLNPNYPNAYLNRSLVRKAAGDVKGGEEDASRARGAR